MGGSRCVMSFYDTLLAKKLSGSSGGGGDFSTAEVTVTNSSANPFVAYGCLYDDEHSMARVNIYLEGNGIIDLILYKGSSLIELFAPIDKSSVTLSGDVEGVTDTFETNKYQQFIVTGDCTITLS